MSKNGKTKTSIVTRLFFAIALTGLIAILTVAAMGLWYLNSGEDVDFDKLKTAAAAPKIYAANGELARYCSLQDGYATSDEIPRLVKDAFIAVEDKRFYSHNGIDYIRLAGAAIGNIKSGSFAEGGSTITQQLAKNIYLSSEKSLERKLREAKIAVSLEKNFSKEQLLEYYLNMLYFGNGEYGVKNAARRYFGKALDELDVLEAAALAATVKAPSKVNPLSDPDALEARARLVVDLMYEQGLIDEVSHNKAENSNIIIKNVLNENTLDQIYLANALAEAADILGVDEKELVAKGYSVYTYLDYDSLQALAGCSGLKDENGLFAAMTANAEQRAIDAIFADFTLDIDSFARQSGSTLKPLVAYAAAFDCGLLSPSSVLDDSPTDFGGYAPSNYGNAYNGSVSARYALSNSLNVPAVSVLQSIGVSEGAAALAKMDIDCGEPTLSLALGSTESGITFDKLLGGYVTLACGGEYAPLSLVSAISDADGNVVYRRSVSAKRVYSPESCYLVTDCLRDCAKNGTAKKLSPLSFPIAAKTGTVGDDSGNNDAYCLAYTPSRASLFWTGSTDYSSYISQTGGGVPTMAAREFFDSVGPGGDFAIPQGIAQIRLDAHDLALGKLTAASQRAPEYACTEDIFDKRFLPTEINLSFDSPRVEHAAIETSDGATTISFDADPRLNYRVIKKGFLTSDSVLADICDRDGKVTLSDAARSMFPASYAIVPYYLDDRGSEIIGEVSVLRQ